MKPPAGQAEAGVGRNGSRPTIRLSMLVQYLDPKTFQLVSILLQQSQ